MIRTSINIGGNPISDNDFNGVVLAQKVGGHHQFEVTFGLKNEKADLLTKAKSWIGQTINIGFDYASDFEIDFIPVKTVFKGVVTSLELERTRGYGELVVKGYSPTIIMDDGPRTQSFSDAGLQEIIDKIFKPYKGVFPETPSVSPEKSKGAIPYTVQYKESNFSFANRMANRFGEWFYYDGLEMFFGQSGRGEAIELDFGENGLTDFELKVEALPMKSILSAYDYESNQNLEEKTPGKFKTSDLGKAALDLSKEKIFNQEPALNLQTDLKAADLKQMASRREEILGDNSVVFSGISRVPSLAPGVKFHVQDKLLNEDYGEFIVIRITHTIGEGGEYNNRFEAIPAELALPPLTHNTEPPYCETQLAKVLDTNDPDSLGRIQVEFQWQSGTGESTPWIRVATPYMGAEKGFYIIPEVDDQVLVAFENNNPDKPYVLSGMYHGKAAPEWFDADNRYKGFKSKAQNQWKFDDNNESILISAPKEMTLHAGTKITVKTGTADNEKDGEKDSEIHIDAGDGTVRINAKNIIVEAAENITADAGKNIKESAGQNYEMSAGKGLKESAGTKLEMEAGTELKGEGGMKAEIASAQVNVNGSAMVNIKGAMVKIN